MGRSLVVLGLVHRVSYEGRESKNQDKQANRRGLQKSTALASILEEDLGGGGGTDFSSSFFCYLANVSTPSDPPLPDLGLSNFCSDTFSLSFFSSSCLAKNHLSVQVSS